MTISLQRVRRPYAVFPLLDDPSLLSPRAQALYAKYRAARDRYEQAWRVVIEARARGKRDPFVLDERRAAYQEMYEARVCLEHDPETPSLKKALRRRAKSARDNGTSDGKGYRNAPVA